MAACSLPVGPSARLQAQVDPTGRWRTFETAHFNVHVREEYAALGPRAAGEAEAAWAALAALLPPPHRRIELVIADNIDDPNGYASTYPLPNIVVYAIPPAGDVELESYDRWLRLVITHELSHIFHLDQARGWWALGRSVLGRAPFLFPNDYTPPWMREGLAVFYETRLTSAGRLGAAYHRAVVGAAVGEQGGLKLDAENTPTGIFPAGVRAYAFGSAVMGDVSKRLGDSVIARFVNALASEPIPYLEIGAAWRRATGEGVGASWDSAQRVGGGNLFQDGNYPPPPTTQLKEQRLSIAARVSHDGRYVAFAANDGRDATRLMVLDRRPAGDTTPHWRKIARLNDVNGLAWMPDGRVLVSQLEYRDPYSIRSDLWTIGMDGRARQITQGERLREPDVAEDGAIVAVRTVPGGSEIVLIEPEAGARGGAAVIRGGYDARLKVIAPSQIGVEYATPRFGGPDTIAVVRVHGGWHDIRLIDRSGGTLRDITADSVPDIMPAFSPDGAWLTWSRGDDTPQIVGIALRESPDRIVQLTAESWAAYAPAPLGSDSMYYISYHADGYRLDAVPISATEISLGARQDPQHMAPPAPDAGAIREHGYDPLPSLRPQYWVPQAYAEAGGTWIGALSAGNDVLGRHSWEATALAGLGALRGHYYGELAYQYAGIRHAIVDASLSHHPSLLIVTQNTPAGPGNPTTACCNNDDAWNAGVTLIRRRWRTQAALRLGVELTDDIQAERRGASLSGSLTHIITPALAVSPQDGWQVGFHLRHRERMQGPLQSTETVVQASGYLSAASRGFARQVFAIHGAFGTVSGTDPVVFSVGGVSSGGVDFLPGVALGGGLRTFQVRGYAPGALIGRHAMSLSLENRVPLALIDRGLGMLPLGLDKISASLFADGALAWSAQHCPDFVINSGSDEACATGIWSVGAELVSDVAIGYEYLLRLRTGAALRVSDGGRAGVWIALGTAF
ncbi:MAG TPA: hypothetical protein VGI92_08020 [Gemmatimonadales bacterium]|jgi:hypothetical protein